MGENELEVVICGHKIFLPRKRWWTELDPTTNLTGPRRSMVALVSAVSGVEARTQTSPDVSLMAVERPPILKSPSRVNGLIKVDITMTR